MLLATAFGALGIVRRFIKKVSSTTSFPTQEWPSFFGRVLFVLDTERQLPSPAIKGLLDL